MRRRKYDDDDDEDYDDRRTPSAQSQQVQPPPFFPEEVEAFCNMFEPASQFDEEATCLYPHNLRDLFQAYPDYQTGADSYPDYIDHIKSRGFIFQMSPTLEPCIYVKPRFAEYEEVES